MNQQQHQPQKTQEVKEVQNVVSESNWFCTECGAKNTGKFCTECGTKRAITPRAQCFECGFKPEGDIPKFCPQCGNKF